MQSYPLHSLIEGSWFKLICGASYQHLPAVRSLALAYSLAGADCIDVAADPAVIAAAKEGIRAAQKLQVETKTQSNGSPWLMVSINDGEDPHFRKAQFEVAECLTDCPQPCVRVCPASAIDLSLGGVLQNLCYGCGRCIPICPQELIETNSYVSNLQDIIPWLEPTVVDALEIHTQVGHDRDFERVWQEIAPIVDRLKLLAISCTDAPNVISYLRSLYELMSPLSCPLIWQIDGRSMSGDIGKGTTHAAIAFARKVLTAGLPGYIQLAGGTNSYTVDKLKQAKMLKSQGIAGSNSVSGLAYGSYARAILSPILDRLETSQAGVDRVKFNEFNERHNRPMHQLIKLEQDRKLLTTAVDTARELVGQIKSVGN